MDMRNPITGQQVPGFPVGTPYCSNCLYDLTGSTEASKCPECGRPLVEVLARVAAPSLIGRGRSRRYRSEATVFGMPWISVATGPRPEAGEFYGHAKGFIAIGDAATGVIAIGGRAFGVVAFGGLALGGFTAGGASIGAMTAAGGLAVAFPGLAVGGGAFGGIASGGMGFGVVAQGGGAYGVYARGPSASGWRVVSQAKKDPEAERVFQALSAVIPGPVGSPLALVVPMGWSLGLLVIAALVLLGVGAVLKREGGSEEGGSGERRGG